MPDNKPFDAVEELVSLEAMSAMNAALSPDENELADDEHDHDHESKEQERDDFA
ncbi:hypothetical protein [Paenibacillus silvisoli]|uniref:hypothetical protein n=1 Tax=Paenibacillus silvisoli TaxID=3110539 RepID=UPI0028056082|nr:hypothetical protein [Paenibacillus silvisoli]